MAVSPWAKLENESLATEAPPPPGVFAPMTPMASAPPEMAPSVMPSVSRIPTTGEQNIARDEAKLQKVQWNQEHPWGTPENHPGTMGKVAHVFSTLGNIAGNIVAPGVMANIPGTQLNMQEREGQLAKRVGEEQGQESQNAYRGAEQAQTEEQTREAPGKAASSEALQGAQTENLNEPAFQHMETDQGIFAFNPKTKELIPLTYQGAPLKGKQPAQAKPDSPEQQYIDDFQKNHPGASIADAVKGYAADTQKPMRVSVNTGNAELDREASRLGKPYEKGISDANAQLDKIADARAMINGPAEAQALGIPKVLTALVSGQGSGVRITQAELNAIGKARGLSGDVEGTLNSWAGKGKLSAQQQKELTGILDDVHQRITQKQAIHNETLDRINGASSREDIIKADKEARQKLNDLSSKGTEETREYQGHTYAKGGDGQWHLKQTKP